MMGCWHERMIQWQGIIVIVVHYALIEPNNK
jgi:hypothetical protein